MLQYQVQFDEPGKNGIIVVHFPGFEWGVTQGDDEDDALDMAADVIEIYLADRIRQGLPLPVQKIRRGRQYRMVRLPALVSAKAELYSAFLKSELTKADLARRLDIPRMNVDRLFDVEHQSRLDQIEAALEVLGNRLDVTIHGAGERRGVSVESPAKRRIKRRARQVA